MSDGEQESTWDKCVDNSKSFAGRIATPVTPAFDFSKGPANLEQLFEWAKSSDLECPNVFQFDAKQFVDVVKSSLNSACIDSSPSPNTHRIWIKSQLTTCVKLWEKILRADHLGVLNSGKGKFKERENAVMPIAEQLHRAYGVWCRVFSDDFDDGSIEAWERFVSELQMEDEPLDGLRFDSNGVVLPRFLFHAAYELGSKGRQGAGFLWANHISAWFSLFALHDTFKFLGHATYQLCSWRADEDKYEFLNGLRNIKDHWVSSFNIAVQWYDRSWLLDETIYQSNWNNRLKAQLENSSQVKPHPDKPYQALGREDLFKWFMKSSLNLSEEDAWRARHMAQHGECAKSIPLPELKESYSMLFQKAEKKFEVTKDKTEMERLATLRREIQQKRVKVTRVHEVMAEMIPCSVSHVGGALSDDKVKLDAYNRAVVAYKAEQFFSIYEKTQQEKRKLFNPQ